MGLQDFFIHSTSAKRQTFLFCSVFFLCFKLDGKGSSTSFHIKQNYLYNLSHVTNLFQPVTSKAVHMLSHLCENTCKRFLAICRKLRASYRVRKLLSVPIQPACAEQGR